jgi:hypothetical protein
MATIKVQVEIVKRLFLMKGCLDVLMVITEALVVIAKQLAMGILKAAMIAI